MAVPAPSSRVVVSASCPPRRRRAVRVIDADVVIASTWPPSSPCVPAPSSPRLLSSILTPILTSPHVVARRRPSSPLYAHLAPLSSPGPRLVIAASSSPRRRRRVVASSLPVRRLRRRRAVTSSLHRSCPLSPHRRRTAAPACRCHAHASSSSPSRAGSAGSRLHRRRRLSSPSSSPPSSPPSSPYPHLAAASSSCRRRCHFVVDESPSSCRVPVAPSSPPCFPRRRRPAASSPRRHRFIAPSPGRRVALRCASVHLRRRRAGLWCIPVHRRGRASRRRHPSVPAHRRRRPSRHRHPSATVQPSAAPSSPQPSSPLNSVSRRTSRRRRSPVVAAVVIITAVVVVASSPPRVPRRPPTCRT